jgi:hypothetical protein
MGFRNFGLWVMLLAAACVVRAAAEIPAGTVLEIRLLETVTSYSVGPAAGEEVRGVVVAPVMAAGRIVIPMGTEARGRLREKRSTSWGFRHEIARVWIEWEVLRLPGGGEVRLKSRVEGLDNAREEVDEKGRIRGIRSTATLGYRGSNLAAGLAAFDPIAYLFVNVAAARMLRFTEPEIVLPRGAEMLVRVEEPLAVEPEFAPPVGVIARSGEEREELEQLIRALPFRAMKAGVEPSDLVNVVVLGSGAALRRAFLAAGWVEADELTATSVFLTFRSIAENQGYQAAPMSSLVLDDRPPDFELSKTLNSFARRHHVRLWRGFGRWKEMEVLAGAATHDTGIIFSRRKRTFTHSIDAWIDDERTKIVNDLIFTGCVAGFEMVERPWLPAEARRSGELELHTDGAVAVLLLNACESAERDFPALEASVVEPLGGRWQRGVRQGVLIARNDVLRGNLGWQAWEGARWLSRRLRKSPPPERTERSWANPAPEFRWDESAAARPEDELAPGRTNGRPPISRWHPALFELGAQGGRLRYGLPRLDAFRLGYDPIGGGGYPSVLNTASDLGNGWAATVSLTMNSYRYFSQELAFSYQRGKYDLFVTPEGPAPPGLVVETERAGLLTRQFQYAWHMYATPRERRLRPYIAAGTSMQLVHLTNAPLERAGGLFRVGWRNIGLLKSAYNFRRDPPLDGGGIFQMGMQYGAGVKFRAHPRWVVRWDFRETVAAQPDFFSPSFAGDAPNAPPGYRVELTRLGERRKLRQQRYTIGFAFTF